MNHSLCHTDITTCAADALIYSTNVQLMLSGGVGGTIGAKENVAENVRDRVKIVKTRSAEKMLLKRRDRAWHKFTQVFIHAN